jgi:hypothetical protein
MGLVASCTRLGSSGGDEIFTNDGVQNAIVEAQSLMHEALGLRQ